MNTQSYSKDILSGPKEFLFKNSSPRQTIFKNTLWLALAEGIGRFFKLILFIFVARVLGATGYGMFSFALSFVSLFVLFSDFGLAQIVTRELAQDGEKEKEFSSILSLKIILSLVALALMVGGSFFITPDLAIRKAIWILAVYILVSSFSGIIYAFLRARQQMQFEAIGKVLEAGAVTGMGFLIMSVSPSVESLSYSYLFAASAALIFISVFFHLKVFSFRVSFERSIWKKFLSLSWPLGAASIFTTIYNNIDSATLGYLGQIAQTGWYNAAYKIIGVTIIPTALVSQAFYPALAVALKDSKERLQKIWNLEVEVMILVAVPLVVGGITLAPRIIDFIYDPGFFPSVPAFQILLVMAGFFFLCSPLNQILIVFNQQEKFLWVAFWGAVVNVILNLILIPQFSLYGAAGVSVVTQILILCLLFWFVRKATYVSPLNFKFLLTFITVSLSSFLMYLVISYPPVYNLDVIFSVALGALVYAFSLLFLKIIIERLAFPYEASR